MLSGLSVLTPAAWWALLALAVPLLIHLFSRSRGRLVHTGHIDLIRQARMVRVTEPRLTQWLLLLMRLGIFLLATLILAGLAMDGLDGSDAPTVYLAPGWAASASPEEKDRVFDAAETGPETRFFLLQPGFPAVDRAALDDRAQAPGPGPADAGETWSLLAERLGVERHRGPVTVYATDRVMQFGRDRPALPVEVKWRIGHPAPLASPGPGDIRALLAYDVDHAASLRVFEAAFAALKAQRLPGLLWESIQLEQLDEIPADIDWLIVLGKSPPDASRLAGTRRPRVVLTETADDGQDDPGQLVRLPFYPFSEFRVDRSSRSPAPGREDPPSRQILPATAGAAPLLRETRFGRLRLLQFNSRFDPAWSSIAEQPGFPELLLQLMLDPDLDVRRFADARIDAANLSATPTAQTVETPLPRRSLQGWLAILLVMLWVGERWLSERKRRAGR